METLVEKIKEASAFIETKLDKTPNMAVILGTGLGGLVDCIENKKTIKYSDIPYFPVSTVLGHAGEFVTGYIGNKYIMAMNGRFHYYEGYPLEMVTFPVRVMKALGMDDIIITNAAGGMNPTFEPGDIMIIEDHINFLSNNPLLGKNYDELGPRFPDMSEAYNKKLITVAENSAKKLEIKVQKGVYLAVSGPCYETPAELKMMRLMGADAVGMSTVPEVIVANHAGMKVLGISVITDMAVADSLVPLDHERVVATADKAKEKLTVLVKDIILSI